MCICLASLPGWAQTFTGGVRGTIQDNSAAAIGAARVTLTDEGTGVARSTVSGNGGEYSFTAVNPATYSVSVEKPGFKMLEKKGVVVSTQEFLTVDLNLEVGDVTQSVNVTAEDVPLLETENASTGQMIDNQKLEDLPNMGRNPFYEGVKISQNVIPAGDPKFNRMEDQSGSSQISIAGGPIRGNNYLLDGISITDSQNRAVIIPTVESVQEVKLQASTYDAEVGRTGGGTFNLTLKSGTNNFHVAAFGYTWMQDWLANTYFANANGRNANGTLKSPIPNQPFYNYGGALGGPVFVPKVYNGKNKTFWWVTGEGYRQTEAATSVLNVPTALEKVGDFSQSYTDASHTKLQQMYYPTSATTRTPIPNNIIPTSQLNPVGLAMASYYPSPNAATNYFGQPNYNATGIIYDRADQVTAKLEQQITSWWRASASYLHYGSREESNAYFGFSNPGTPGQSMLVRHVDATQANTTITPSPTMVVYLRWGFNRFPNRTYQLASEGIDMTKWGFPGSYISQLPYHAFPAITMTGDMSSYGAGGLSQSNFYSRSFSGSVSKFMGKHSVKAGFDYRVIHDSGEQTVTPGAFSFDSTFTSSTPGKTAAGTGGALASMLLGFPASGSVTTSLPIENHVTYYGGFFQDDFRVSKKLTLNLGLRYEYETGLESERNSLIVGFDTKATNPLQSQVTGITTRGVLEYAGQNGYGTTAMRPNVDKFAPRLGFAYNIRPKTTIRGGYGLFWAPFTFNLVNPLGYTYSTPYVASNDGNATPATSLSNPFPAGIQQPLGNGAGLLAGIGGQNIAFYSNSAHSTRVHQMSLDVQHELPGAIVVDLGFVGSITHNLIQGTPDVNINQLPGQYLPLGSALNSAVPNPFYGTAGGVLNLASPTITLAKSLLPYPQYGTVAMQSSDQNHALYTSVYFKLQKRVGRSVNILNTITWSKNEDASNGASNNFNAQQTTSQDNYNRAGEWGLATIDTPLRWTTAINYELPFGTGKKFLARNKMLDVLVGGWAMNVQTTMQNGFPLAIYQTNTNSAIGTSVQRPNATGVDPSTTGSVEERLNSYLNKAAFTSAPQFTFGNVSRTIPVRGPGQANTDFSLFKSYNAEKFRAQFRCEVFNLTNTPQFNGPTTNFSSASFGAVTSQANFNRVFQLGVRFEY
jgi:trimeric autotransporter adhesin